MYAAAAAYDDRGIARALPENVALSKLERVIAVVEHGRPGAHHADIHQAAVAIHDPPHDGEHLPRAGDVDNLQVSDGVEDDDVVVAHVGCAVGAGLEIG